MSANSVDYAKMFGTICEGTVVMAKCACVACNSCTCACSCRNIPDLDEFDWEQKLLIAEMVDLYIDCSSIIGK